MFVAPRDMLSKIIVEYGKHPIVSFEDGDGTWYPSQVCIFLNLKHHLHSPFEKSIIIERIMQYIKDITK